MESVTGTGSIESRKDFKDTPSDQYKYWDEELKASERTIRNWRKEGTKIDRKYKGGSRTSKGGNDTVEVRGGGGFRLNLFHSNAITIQSMLYDDLPKVDVSRRYSDPNDDVGRVASEIMQRILNSDVQDNPEVYDSTLEASLQDRLLPGLGCARVRYDMVEKDGSVVSEDAPIEYVHWRDVQWGWARTFAEIPWIGFRTYMTKEEITEKWGEEAGNGVQLKKQSATPDRDEPDEPDDSGPWMKGEIWEIWDKKKKRVVWVSPGYDKTLDQKDDFLKLSSFYPCPPFLLANQTTSLYVPTSDYYLAQDLYNEIDVLQTRIAIITGAVKVVGVYNMAAGDISRVFKEGTDNDLIPVDNWALFAESGGIKGQIDWVPLKDIVEALGKLRELRDEAIGLLQQVTGMSDIMRGELGGQYEGVGQSKLKVQFGSVRVKAMQKQFAMFASKLMQIKAEVIGLHFDPETIAMLANAESFMDEDKELIPAAIMLIKDPPRARLHTIIRPETMAMIDYDQMQNDRTEYLGAIGAFMQASSPLMEAEPAVAPFLLQLLKWGLSGFKGSQQIEGVVDKAIQVATEAAAKGGEKPDPGDQAAALEKAKSEGAMELESAKHENKMTEIQAKAAADDAEMKSSHMADMTIIKAELGATLREITAKMVADIKAELATSRINAEQARVQQEGELEKSAIESGMKIEEAKQKPTSTTGSD